MKFENIYITNAYSSQATLGKSPALINSKNEVMTACIELCPPQNSYLANLQNRVDTSESQTIENTTFNSDFDEIRKCEQVKRADEITNYSDSKPFKMLQKLKK